MQEEVKRFLQGTRQSKCRGQSLSAESDDGSLIEDELESSPQSSLEQGKQSGVLAPGSADGPVERTSVSDNVQDHGEARSVDVVLSDMSAPWEQTEGFWKRSLSDPYYRMMNTSGINFRDHAGSMVCPMIHKSCW